MKSFPRAAATEAEARRQPYKSRQQADSWRSADRDLTRGSPSADSQFTASEDHAATGFGSGGPSSSEEEGRNEEQASEDTGRTPRTGKSSAGARRRAGTTTNDKLVQERSRIAELNRTTEPSEGTCTVERSGYARAWFRIVKVPAGLVLGSRGSIIGGVRDTRSLTNSLSTLCSLVRVQIVGVASDTG